MWSSRQLQSTDGNQRDQGHGKSTKVGWALVGGGSLALSGIVVDERRRREIAEQKNMEMVKPESETNEMCRKDKQENWYVNKEDKIRHYSPIENLFDYFSSYQVIDNQGMINNRHTP